MKRLIQKRWSLPAALVLLYLAGAVLGVLFIGGFPVFSGQKNYLFDHARELARQWPDFILEELGEGGENRILILDRKGMPLLAEPRPVPWFTIVAQKLQSESLPAVLTGRELYRWLFVPEMNDLVVVAGVPVMEGSEAAGAVFMIRNLKNVPESVEAYLIFFTLVFAVTAYFSVSASRRKHRLDELQRTYIANVTHTLKTPVASIRALSEALCDEVVQDPLKQKLYYSRILLETKKQERMIRDILELSELQSAGRDFTKMTIPASECFTPVLENYRELCGYMDTELIVNEALSGLPPLRTNADCVRELLGILLENAMKFAPEGKIRVDFHSAGKSAVISVRDSGSGISAEDLPYIFDRFYKSKSSGNENGSGLGLAIARELADGLHEKLWAESHPGEGASFFFTVRLA